MRTREHDPAVFFLAVLCLAPGSANRPASSMTFFGSTGDSCPTYDERLADDLRAKCSLRQPFYGEGSYKPYSDQRATWITSCWSYCPEKTKRRGTWHKVYSEEEIKQHAKTECNPSKPWWGFGLDPQQSTAKDPVGTMRCAGKLPSSKNRLGDWVNAEFSEHDIQRFVKTQCPDPVKPWYGRGLFRGQNVAEWVVGCWREQPRQKERDDDYALWLKSDGVMTRLHGQPIAGSWSWKIGHLAYYPREDASGQHTASPCQVLQVLQGGQVEIETWDDNQRWFVDQRSLSRVYAGEPAAYNTENGNWVSCEIHEIWFDGSGRINVYIPSQESRLTLNQEDLYVFSWPFQPEGPL